MKKTLYNIAVFSFVLAMLSMASTMSYAKTASLSVKAIQDGDKDRIIFDWGKMVAYDIEEARDGFVIRFQARPEKTPKELTSNTMPFVKGVGLLSQGAKTSAFKISTNEGVKLKDFRLVRRVVIDVSKDPKSVKKAKALETTSDIEKKLNAKTDTPVEKDPVTKRIEEKRQVSLGQPQSLALNAEEDIKAEQGGAQDAKTEEKPLSQDAAAIEAPLKKALTTALEGSGGVDVPEVIVDQAPEPESAMVKEPIAPQDPTIITLSILEETALAVFERQGFLWVVSEIRNGEIKPEIFGPLKEALGAPSVYDLDGGIAYRFVMLPKTEVEVLKKTLAWQIVLSDTAPPSFSTQRPKIISSAKGARQMVVPFSQAGPRFELRDPNIGDIIDVVTTNTVSIKTRESNITPTVHILKTKMGFASILKSVDVTLDVEDDRLVLSSEEPQGLAVSDSARRIVRVNPFVTATQTKQLSKQDQKRLFNLDAWRRGGLEDFFDNKVEILKTVNDNQSEEERVQALFDLALLYFSNGFGDEALGLLDLVESLDEDISKRLSFVAIRGAAKSLAGRHREALKDLTTASLQDQPEAQLWAGYSASALEEWTRAERLFPKTPLLLNGYPQKLAIPIALYMAESALRSGDPTRAAELLGGLSNYADEVPVRYDAARLYLRGEMFRQNDQPEKAIETWEKVLSKRDRLYRAKAKLAQTLLARQTDAISEEEALNRLEGMRFAWRDDLLETQILQSIGLLRVLNQRYYDGLVQLKTAARLSESRQEDTAPILRDMQRIFNRLFVEGDARKIPLLEAISVYNEFPELHPIGKDGLKAAMTLSEFLVEMDLLSRAADTLKSVIESKSLTRQAEIDVGLRLAAIYLLDNEPSKALTSLGATEALGDLQDKSGEEKLLRARAYSQLNQTENAISVIDGLSSEDALRLKADIYWRASNWEKAAQVLKQLFPDPSEKNVSEAQYSYILNVAVALKLNGDNAGLARLKSNYWDIIKDTKFANSFQIVTRPASSVTLSDRKTMLSIAGEVDIFKGFLNTYKAQN